MKRSLIVLLMGPLTASAAYFSSLPNASCSNQHTVFGGNAADLQDINAVVQLDDQGREIRKNGKAVDPRGPLAVKGPQFSGDLKMSQDEVNEIKNAVRVLECGKMGGTAIIYGNGGQIVTALHNVMTEQHTLKGPCYLRKPGEDGRHDVAVRLNDLEILESPVDVHGIKVAVIRLDRRMTDTKGHSLGVSLSAGRPLERNKKIAMVSAYQLGLDGKEIESRPLGQECRGRLNERDFGAVSFGDCWFINSGSGSGGFAREGEITDNASVKAFVDRSSQENLQNSKKPLVLTSIAVKTGESSQDNMACDPTKYSCSIIINFNSSMIEKMHSFEHNGDRTAEAGAVDKTL